MVSALILYDLPMQAQPFNVMEKIVDELAELHAVLQWSTEHPLNEVALTTGQRIMVNQERAALFRAIDGKPRDFIQSPIVMDKIIRILYLITRTAWVPKN